VTFGMDPPASLGQHVRGIGNPFVLRECESLASREPAKRVGGGAAEAGTSFILSLRARDHSLRLFATRRPLNGVAPDHADPSIARRFGVRIRNSCRPRRNLVRKLRIHFA
jgi:hypothetical protein